MEVNGTLRGDRILLVYDGKIGNAKQIVKSSGDQNRLQIRLRIDCRYHMFKCPLPTRSSEVMIPSMR